MAALGVDKVYRFVQFVANKESRGWIDPAEFNINAELAQLAAYSKREAVFLASKVILNDMRPFMKNSSTITPTGAGLAAYPADLRHFVNAWIESDFQEIQELTQAELPAAMKSTVCSPSTAYPAGVQRDDGFQLYPISLGATDIMMEYIASPTAPNWTYDLVLSRPVYDATDPLLVNFGFDEVLFIEIAMLILANCGVNLGMENVAQYGMAFNQGK